MSLDAWAVERVTDIMRHIVSMTKNSEEMLEFAMLTATVENEGALYLLSGDGYEARSSRETTVEDEALEAIMTYGLDRPEPLNSFETVACELLMNCCFDLLNKIGKISKRQEEITADQVPDPHAPN